MEGESIRSADSTRKKKYLNKLLLLIPTILIFTIPSFVILDKSLSSFSSKYRINLDHKMHLKNHSFINDDDTLTYNSLMGIANVKFNRGHFDEAYLNYHQALEVRPQSKNANLGLAKCLIIECKRQNNYCKEAESYYNLIITSKSYNQNDIRELIDLKSP